jgi:hypothetical protein
VVVAVGEGGQAQRFEAAALAASARRAVELEDLVAELARVGARAAVDRAVQ